MYTPSDQELLRRYLDQGAEEAFTELVRRHCDLVWAAARRVSGNNETARDVAQLVFSDLARKARQLPAGTILAGWLYQAACRAAANQVRGEIRRKRREDQIMQPEPLQPAVESGPEPSSAAELQPVLDSALAELSDADRDAVVLRFLAGRSLAEVGATLGSNEDAAQKRVSRALEKLREAFRRRGVTASSTLIVAALGAAGLQTAPVGLAAAVASGALAGAVTTAGTISWISLMKTKLILGTVGGAIVAAALVQQQRNIHQLADENDALRQQIEARSATSAAEAPGVDGAALAQQRNEQAELLRLRGEVARLRQGALDRENRVRAAGAASEPLEPAASPEAEAAREHSNHIVQAMKNLGLAARVFATDHQDQFPTTFDDMRDILNLPPNGSFPGEIALDLFEYFPHERVISEQEPQLILFREKVARQLPDGQWERIYCNADGSVQTHSNATGDFSQIELEGKGTVANAPKKP